MRLILSSLYKTIATGPGSIVHVDGGLLRYHVEEHLANKIDDDIKRVFKVDLRQAYQAKTNETHFLVYYRNAIFYYERFLFFAWNVFWAHYRNSGRLTKVYPFPPFINKVNDLTISAFLIVAGLVKLVNLSFLWMRSTSFKPTEFSSSKKTHNIAVQYYLGIDPQKRNDLFLLRNFENDKITNCFVVATNKKDFVRLKYDLAQFEDNIQQTHGREIRLIPYFHAEDLFSNVIPCFCNSIALSKKFEISSFVHPLIFIFMMIFETKKNTLVNFFTQYNIKSITNTNFNHESCVISAAAFSVNTKSIFKEVTVWGDWSSVYNNRVLCDTWIASTKQSADYIKKTQHFIDHVITSAPPIFPTNKRLISAKQNEGLKVLIIGSNASKNDKILIPQHISIDTYRQNLYSYFSWASERENVWITVKEKKTNSLFFQQTMLDCRQNGTKFFGIVEFIRQPAGQLLSDFAQGYDLFIALGTFYPSSIYELANYVPQDRLIFWDMTNLTKVFPKINESKTLTVCTSIEEVVAISERLLMSKASTKMQ